MQVCVDIDDIDVTLYNVQCMIHCVCLDIYVINVIDVIYVIDIPVSLTEYV